MGGKCPMLGRTAHGGQVPDAGENSTGQVPDAGENSTTFVLQGGGLG